jgi:hypothetical protein
MNTFTRLLLCGAVLVCVLVSQKTQAWFGPNKATKELYRNINDECDDTAAMKSIQQGADVNYVADKGLSMLHLAAMRNYLPMVQTLFDAWANPTVRDMFGEQPWQKATDPAVRDFLYNASMRNNGITDQDQKAYEYLTGQQAPAF